MHALFVTPAFPPFPGGGERYARSLAVNLAQQGIAVTVLTTTAAKESDLWYPDQPSLPSIQLEQDGPLRIIRCATDRMPGGFRGLLAWRKIMVILSSLPGDQSRILSRMARRVPDIPTISAALNMVKAPVDLVHGFNISWENAMTAGWRYSRQQSVPFVATPFLHTGVSGRDRVSRNTTMDHQLQLLRDANGIQTLTNIERDMLGKLGCDPSRLDSVGSGIDPLPSIDGSAINWVDQQSAGPFILFIGRNSYDKGCIHAVESVLEINRHVRNLKLLIAGQPTPELSNFVAKKNIGRDGRVRILGVVSEGQKHALLEKSQMLLIPSRTDSFGIVILEAWAHGKPVIGARAGGISEVISDGEDGFLVRFGDVKSLAEKIKILLDNPGLGQELASNGRRKLDEIYNWEHVGNLVVSNYQKILAGDQ